MTPGRVQGIAGRTESWTKESDSHVYLSVRADVAGLNGSLRERIIGVFRMNNVRGIILFH